MVLKQSLTLSLARLVDPRLRLCKQQPMRPSPQLLGLEGYQPQLSVVYSRFNLSSRTLGPVAQCQYHQNRVSDSPQHKATLQNIRPTLDRLTLTLVPLEERQFAIEGLLNIRPISKNIRPTLLHSLHSPQQHQNSAKLLRFTLVHLHPPQYAYTHLRRASKHKASLQKHKTDSTSIRIALSCLG